MRLFLEPGGLVKLDITIIIVGLVVQCVFLEPGGSGALVLMVTHLHFLSLEALESSVLMVKHMQTPYNCKPFLSFFLSFFAPGLRKGPAADRSGSRILTINPSLNSRRC